MGLLMPPVGPGAERGAPGHVAEEERGRDQISPTARPLSISAWVLFCMHSGLRAGCFTPSFLGRCNQHAQSWCGSGHPNLYLPWWQQSK